MMIAVLPPLLAALTAAGGPFARRDSTRPAVPAAPAASPAPRATEVVPPPVEREFRAAWISPVGGGGAGDWPSSPRISADSQRAELRRLLDQAKAIGLNAVIFHVRTAGDALYPSGLAPWSAFLTGTSGGNPGYDPLAFAVEEAHARGLQLHAWFNPFRAVLPNFAGRASADHVTRAHPEWVRKYGSQTWIDPGDPAARRAVLASVLEVVTRYDVDGVHIDDYFYPYRESETVTKTVVERVRRKRVRRVVSSKRDIDFPDGATWRRYGAGAGWTNRADWRRDNVNQFVRDMYTEVKRAKPWVLVGVSPFGIWRSGTPAGVTGLDAYGEIYADSRRWLAEGWMDYMAPQLYWELEGTQRRFAALDRWWRAQNPHDRHIWPGLASMHLRSGRWPAREIGAQIRAIRDWRGGTDDVPGHVHFRMSSIGGPMAIVGYELRDSVYGRPALVPAFPWLAGGRPAAPRVTWADSGGARSVPRRVLVSPGDSVAVVWWLVQQRAADGSWSASVRRAGPAPDVITVTDSLAPVLSVRALDRAGQEGAPTVVGLLPPRPAPVPTPAPTPATKPGGV